MNLSEMADYRKRTERAVGLWMIKEEEKKRQELSEQKWAELIDLGLLCRLDRKVRE